MACGHISTTLIDQGWKTLSITTTHPQYGRSGSQKPFLLSLSVCVFLLPSRNIWKLEWLKNHLALPSSHHQPIKGSHQISHHQLSHQEPFRLNPSKMHSKLTVKLDPFCPLLSSGSTKSMVDQQLVCVLAICSCERSIKWNTMAHKHASASCTKSKRSPLFLIYKNIHRHQQTQPYTYT